MGKPSIADAKAIKPTGLTEIYGPHDDATIDIVFVHGLNGHPHDTWTSKSTGCFWPTDLLPDVLAKLRPRILTYGYNANVVTFTDGTSRDTVVSHAETFASSLAANRNLRGCSERPLIFICHSLGGLIVKRALIYSRSLSNEKTEHLRAIYVSTFGILFLGTPHNGSDIAKWGLLLQNICNAVLPKKIMESSSQLIKALRTNNETLQHINSLFVDIMDRFHIYFFHETRSTDVRGTREVIVDEYSAAPYMAGVERAGIEADHSHMCKFDDENAPGYEVVAEAVLRYSSQAPAVIADRWVAEKNFRVQEKKNKAREIYDARVEDPPNRSMPDLNRTGRALPAPEEIVTLRDYEIEEPAYREVMDPAVYDELREYLPSLPRAPATEGRNSPVSDLENSGILQLSRHSIRDQPLFVAPPGFHPNDTFFGMKKELEVLHVRLFKAKARLENTMSVLIFGVPGAGKTHLARQYVFAKRDCYPGGIFWVDAKSRESLYKCFWEIAQAATLVEPKLSPAYHETQRYVNAVRSWLQSRKNWLLVFDGMTFDYDEDINKFRDILPWSKQCSILYTSVDKTLRKKARLYEPYGLEISPLHVEDACKLLFKDLGIKIPTPRQKRKAIRIVEYFECLPLAIRAVGHRLKATGKPIEKYRFKSQLTDKKLAEPFLGIMGDLFRLQKSQALHLINLLSFLGHQVPVGLLDLGRVAMTNENLEIQTSAQLGDEPDLDTTLGTLIRHGLIERTSASGILGTRSFVQPCDDDDGSPEAKKALETSHSSTESSQEELFSMYQHQSAVDVVKIHSVVQGFCRDELRIRDEESKGIMNPSDPGCYDAWLIVATRFLTTSYEAAVERMAQDETCGLVRDHREYETHASRLLELFPKKPAMNSHPHIVGVTRDGLRNLMKTISREIESLSPSSSQDFTRQRSVFDRSSSSSSSSPGSPTEAEDVSPRRDTFDSSAPGSPRAEPPESDQLAQPAPRFAIELFPPHVFNQAGTDDESEEGYESDAEVIAEGMPGMQISHTTEKPDEPPPPPISPPASGLSEWHLVDRDSKRMSGNEDKQKQRNKGLRPFRCGQSDTPLVGLSSVHGKGSTSRTSAKEIGNSSVFASQAKQALAAVRRSSNPQLPPEAPEAVSNKENKPTYANVASRQILKAESAPMRPPSAPIIRTVDSASGLQVKLSTESLDSEVLIPILSPPSHGLDNETRSESLGRSTFSDPESFHGYYSGPDFHTAPGSRSESRRGSLAPLEVPSLMSASVPCLIPYQQRSSYDEKIPVASPSRRASAQLSPFIQSRPLRPSPAPAHPSAIMPGPLSRPLQPNMTVGSAQEQTIPTPEPSARNSPGYSPPSWSIEPERHPGQFSPPTPGFQGTPEAVPGVSRMQQQQLTTGPTIWTVRRQETPNATQPDSMYLGSPTEHGSLDERVNTIDRGWAPAAGSPTELGSLDEIVNTIDRGWAPAAGSPTELGSLDEIVNTIDRGWAPAAGSGQFIHFGGHRVDVREARQRRYGLVQHEGQVHVSPSPPIVWRRRRRRGRSSPARPDLAGPELPSVSSSWWW
ncbi:uncharacterized protein N7515_004442 [Penicillium bovifimosum]|uniref:NB-ARC domain-containing protein n=1 Tax=Penicillium bovifimosum TaxID=126998 RepID=A0A9W9L406_9EURO|nr:uncharacterized protein N7515_004442 [Penicillium bovifimosum]KAJ5135164.1 hypothetical protein N7515_004442 [Penicillium bovifimosum]